MIIIIVFLALLIALLISGIVNLIHAFINDGNKLLWGCAVILETIVLISLIMEIL